MLRRYSSSLKRNDSSPQLPARRQRTMYCGLCELGLKGYHKVVNSRVVSRKYSASQNFFYTRDIGDLLESTKLWEIDNSTKVSVLSKDFAVLDSPEEHMSGYSDANSSQHSLRELAEYFKYYKDIPRLFMKPIHNIYRKHH